MENLSEDTRVGLLQIMHLAWERVEDLEIDLTKEQYETLNLGFATLSRMANKLKDRP